MRPSEEEEEEGEGEKIGRGDCNARTGLARQALDPIQKGEGEKK